MRPQRADREPDLLVFDLDPGAPATIVDCCRVAEALRPVLEADGLAPLPKTSGGKGLQLYARDLRHDRGAGQRRRPRTSPSGSNASMPRLVVSRMTRSLRTGKVLIDWSAEQRLQDHRRALLAARPRAPHRLDPRHLGRGRGLPQPQDLFFTAADVLDRVAEHGDLFAPLLS